jgi:hypothetical protein
MADRQSKLFYMGKIYPFNRYLSGNSSKWNGPAAERGDLRMGPGLSFDSLCTKQYDFNIMVLEADRRTKRLYPFLNFMLHTLENSLCVCHALGDPNPEFHSCPFHLLQISATNLSLTLKWTYTYRPNLHDTYHTISSKRLLSLFIFQSKGIACQSAVLLSYCMIFPPHRTSLIQIPLTD